jgi:phosphoserine phosphatase RsbU/P
MSAALRLAQIDEAASNDPAIPSAPSSPSVGPKLAGESTPAIEAKIAELHSQIETLAEEIAVLRQRDDTINSYMMRIDEELRLAARLQQDFLPKFLPQIGGVRFHTLYRPAGYVSGDLYDVMRLDEEHVGFYMADAVGHGMPAALLTMFIKNAMVTKEITPLGYRLVDPSETLRRLNAAMVEQNLSQGTFATALCGIINTRTLMVRFARGGHPNPLLQSANGSLQTIESEGGLLGIFPDEIFAESTVQLQRGQRLILHSDGVEVSFYSDRILSGIEWQNELQSRAHLTSAQLLAELEVALESGCGSLSPKDDVTMIVLDCQ